jgi:hypothetical protein
MVKLREEQNQKEADNMITVPVKTPKELEKAITPDMIAVAQALFSCMAIVETIKPIVEGYQKKILEEEKYSYAEKWHNRRDITHADWIKDPNNTYLMNDQDFQHFMKRTRQEQARAGLKTESPEFCPLLVAEHNVIKAQNLLIDVMEPVTGIKRDDIMVMEHRRQYIDITLRLFAPMVKEAIR